jgi:hypothetical protein
LAGKKLAPFGSLAKRDKPPELKQQREKAQKYNHIPTNQAHMYRKKEMNAKRSAKDIVNSKKTT